MKKRLKKYTDKELAEAHVFHPDLPDEDIREADKEFSARRVEQLKKRSEEDRYYARIMQLKYLMEDYIETEEYREEYTFGYFLREYIHSLNKSISVFSDDIGLHNTKLSRLLNNRDEPNDKILVRLEVHSGNTIPAIVWFRLIEKERGRILENNQQLRREESRHVKRKLEFT